MKLYDILYLQGGQQRPIEAVQKPLHLENLAEDTAGNGVYIPCAILIEF